MSSSSAARQMDDYYDPEASDPGPAYSRVGYSDEATLEDAGTFQPRFRVVVRRAAMATAKQATTGSLHFPVALAAIPVVCLLVYIMFWTLSMRGGFYRSQLERQIQHERVVRAELEAELNRKRAPGLIGVRAKQLDMVRPERRVFAWTTAIQSAP